MTTADLLARHRDEWLAATRSPFLDSISNGSLAEPAFRNWLAQDYLYICDLLRFQGRLLSVAPRSGQAVLTAGLVALEAELSWFEGHARRLALSLDVVAHAATAAYARTLSDCANDWRRGITALWTGERAYLDGWSAVGPAPAPYGEFVAHWSQSEFVSYVEQLGALVDEVGGDEQTFVTVCLLERDFWDMACDSAGS
jgi:formylaminopyrimidine deformylase / aminopyrimidine aminohydrolase